MSIAEWLQGEPGKIRVSTLRPLQKKEHYWPPEFNTFDEAEQWIVDMFLLPAKRFNVYGRSVRNDGNIRRETYYITITQ